MMESNNYQRQIEERFLRSLQSHLAGLRAKVEKDFSQSSFEQELAALSSDPIYPSFAFDTPEYVLVRLVGRVSISIGRRLGEIYDKIPRFLVAARFGLAPEQVAPKYEGLELDIGLRLSLLVQADQEHVREVVQRRLGLLLPNTGDGVGIEIRYNFNPNDSARLRKDVAMATHLQHAGLLPIYLIFSAISPRDEAIARLRRAGWNFLVGTSAITFAQDLFGLDIASILDSPKVKAEVQEEVASIMKAMIKSYAFQAVLARHPD